MRRRKGRSSTHVGFFVLFFYPCVLIWDFRGDDKLKPGRVETRERENWIRLRAPPARKKM